MRIRYKPGCGTAGLLAVVVAAAMLGSETLLADGEDSLFPIMLLLGGIMLAAIGLLRRLLRTIPLLIRWPHRTPSRSPGRSGGPAHGHGASAQAKLRELLADFRD